MTTMESFFENDEKLIAAIKASNKHAYTFLYKAYYNKLCAYVYSLNDDGKQAEDIVQDVLLKFWVKRKAIKINSSLNAFLYRSVHNAYLDTYRKDRRKHKLIEELRLEAVMELEEKNYEEKEKKIIRLHQIINTLPKKRREIFILNKLKNLKYREIAELQKISVRTVESQIRKAMLTIRNSSLNNYFF